MLNTEKVKRLMAEKGISNKELAACAGVTSAMMSYIANGLKAPSLIVAQRIAKALGCKVDDLTIDE